MDSDDTNFDSIFGGAIEIACAEERAAFIARACGPDEDLRRRVERLVGAHFQAGSFLESPPASPTVAIDSGRAAVSGTVIGPYKLLQPIGEGGMGTVYMAEQTAPVRRLVALKVIKAGMDSRQVLARFEAERQALALMDHPNIAKVLDAGTTDDGRPYFVMELVKGVPMTRFCDEHRLSTRERLELAIPVCQAIQHAHQKGVIHRDLKPSNILVARYDDKPVPKVIDFGVAKATGRRLTDQTLYTEFGAVVGTLEYMSPEQAQLNQLDIDTRSDVYSLGVLLYELLTGSTPLDRRRLKEAGLLEVLRVIREEESPRPSVRLSTTEELPSIAACRGIEPRRLSGLLRGELDWIVMKALEKDRNRRYESASELARDLERYLHDEPVLAGPPGAGYRVRKFVRRNRGGVLAATLLLLALVGGVIGTTVGLRMARRRLAQIEKANEILGSIFKDLNPDAAEKEGKPLQALLGERLDQATEQLEGEVIGDSLAVARMQMILGRSQLGLGYAQKAILLLSKARTTFTARLGPDHPDTLDSMGDLALGYYHAGNHALAVPLFEETLKRVKAKLGPDHRDTFASMHNLALGYDQAGKRELAVPLLEESFKLTKAKLGPDHPDTLDNMADLGRLYIQAGKLDLALPLFEQTLRRRKVTLGPDHPHTLGSMNNLGMGYWEAGKLDLALPLYEETLRRRRVTLGPDHPDTLTSISNLGTGYWAAGKLDLALPLFEESLRRRKATLGPDHPDTLTSMHNLGRGYEDAGKLELALPLYEETARRRRVTLGPDHPDTLRSMHNLGNGYWSAGKLDLALPLYEETLRRRKVTLGSDHADTLGIMNSLALGYKDARKLDLAVPLYEETLRRRKETLGPDHLDTLQSMNSLGMGYEAAGKLDLALPLLEETLKLIKAKLGPNNPKTLTVMTNLGKVYIRSGHTAKAEPVLRESLAIAENMEPNAWTTFHAKSLLGEALLGQKNYAGAEPLLLAGYEGMKEREAKIPTMRQYHMIHALERLVQLYEATGNKDKAREWQNKLTEARVKKKD